MEFSDAINQYFWLVYLHLIENCSFFLYLFRSTYLNKMTKMNILCMIFYSLCGVIRKFGFFVILCLQLTGCGLLTAGSSQDSTSPGEGALSGHILIAIAPIGERPLVFRSAKDNAICRRGYPIHEYGLETEVTEDSSEIQSGESSSEGSETTENTEALVSKIFTSVGEGWFKIGLTFANNSDYFLVVEDLDFTISAFWGEELLNSNQTLSGGYCDSDPLYLVPPKSRVLYNPDRNHSMGNLQLYVDGVSIPAGPPIFSETQSEAATPPAELQNQQRHPEIFTLTYLPSYQVQLVVTGHFMDERRTYIGNFSRELTFHTASKF